MEHWAGLGEEAHKQIYKDKDTKNKLLSSWMRDRNKYIYANRRAPTYNVGSYIQIIYKSTWNYYYYPQTSPKQKTM